MRAAVVVFIRLIQVIGGGGGYQNNGGCFYTSSIDNLKMTF